MRYTGGYVLHRNDLFLTNWNSHTSSLPSPISPEALAAINSVQATPWRINGFVLDTMTECWRVGIELPGLPSPDDVDIPERLPDDVWASMTDDERRETKKARAMAYTKSAQLVSKRDALMRKLDVAQSLRAEDRIWFPHGFDFRFRMYPLPQDLNPQGDDVAKGLLMFADGLPIGPSGYRWIMIHTANTFGQDKLPLDERVEWCMDHMLELTAAGMDPLENTFWMSAEEPWCALAACQEIRLIGEYGLDHVSHLPVQVDGSCNGLQHLSALGRDPIGAAATNVAANAVRQDIYQRVADRATTLVTEDIRRGNTQAAVWAGAIDRKVVKRAVMTTPYGVTDRGIRDQLVNDGMTRKVLGDNYGHQAAADYLADVIRRAMDDTISSASAIMGYLQDTAGALAKQNVPLIWTNAAGCQIQQAYYRPGGKEIRTLIGRMRMVYEDRNQGLDPTKQRNGAAPNYIHSQDAAHMALTVNRARDAYGIRHWSMIHDSYGTHAARMDALSMTLRATFAEMYQEDLLGRFHQEQLAVAGPMGIDLPAPPKPGDFDVNEVLASPFFFA